jgi:hypothetical protein
VFQRQRWRETGEVAAVLGDRRPVAHIERGGDHLPPNGRDLRSVEPGHVGAGWRQATGGGAHGNDAQRSQRYGSPIELPRLIIQFPRGSAVERGLRENPPAGSAEGEIVLEAGPTDSEGALEAVAGQAVLSLPSPEALRRQAEEVHRVLVEAGTGAEPLVVVVQAAQELRADELAVIVAAARHSPRTLILRIIRDA